MYSDISSNYLAIILSLKFEKNLYNFWGSGWQIACVDGLHILRIFGVYFEKNLVGKQSLLIFTLDDELCSSAMSNIFYREFNESFNDYYDVDFFISHKAKLLNWNNWLIFLNKHPVYI